jgi:hypothetical protein
MILKKLYLASMCLFFVSMLFAGDLALIDGPNHVYALMVPDGWMFNKTLAKKIGVPAPFFIHPIGEYEVKSYIYSYGYECGEQSLQDYISTSNERLKKLMPNIAIVSKGKVVTKKGIHALVYHYKNYPDGHVEDVGYLKEKNIICVIALSSRDNKSYNKRYEDFKKTVESFYYITDSPKSLGK